MENSKRHILSIDSGTSGIRAVLFDHAGKIVAQEYRTTDPLTAEAGAVEHDPETLWRTLLDVTDRVFAAYPADQTAAVGICNQRGSFCLWERETGRPLTNFISWADVRSAGVMDAMNRDWRWRTLKFFATILSRVTGSKMLLATSLLSFTTDHASVRLKWVLNENPELKARCERGEVLFGTLDTYYIYRLTGGKRHVSDAGNAGATGLFNPFQLRWNDVLCKIFDLPMSIFPEVLDTNGEFGLTASDRFSGACLPIRAAAGDQMAALFGQQCFAPGQVKISQGSGAFVDLHTGARPKVSRRGLLPLLAWSINGEPTYMLEGFVATAGTLLNWLGHGIGLSDTAAELDQLAAQTENTEGVFFFPTPTGIRYPYFNPHVKASITGLSLATHRRHVARAVLEGIAMRLYEILDGMQRDTGVRLTALRVDGGVSRSDVLLQCLANFTGIPVERAPESEMAATGTAYLAGLAVGFWKNTDELPVPGEYEKFSPAMNAIVRKKKVRRWKKAQQLLLGLDQSPDE